MIITNNIALKKNYCIKSYLDIYRLRNKKTCIKTTQQNNGFYNSFVLDSQHYIVQLAKVN
jgi:hypothetical protein